MYNRLKVNMLDENCDCEYALCENNPAYAYYPRIYIQLYVGEGLTQPNAILYGNAIGEQWLATDNYSYENGLLTVSIDYEDFAKSGNAGLVVEVHDEGVRIGNRALLIFSENLTGAVDEQWQLTAGGVSGNAVLFNVAPIGTASGSGGGGSGGGGGTTYIEGQGIKIDGDEISAKIGNGLEFDAEGRIKTNPLVIENAVILSEDKASYMLHKYNEISYVSGQRAVYSEVGSSIIAQGYSHYNGRCKTVIDGATLAETFPDGVPSGYNSFNLNLATSSGVTTTNYLIEAYHEYVNDSYGLYIRYSSDGGTTWTVSRQTAYGTFDRPDYFIYWKFTGIYAPTEAFPCGYATASLYKVGHIKSYDGYRETAVSITNVTNSMKIPFASEAEYNAAIALTYEPNILTMVNETTTESN